MPSSELSVDSQEIAPELLQHSLNIALPRSSALPTEAWYNMHRKQQMQPDPPFIFEPLQGLLFGLF